MDAPSTTVTRPYLCLDFGGTKLAVAIVDASTGGVLCTTQRPTPAGEGAQASLRIAVDACDDLLRASPVLRRSVLGIGISFGGPLSDDRRTVIRSMHVDSWGGVALPDALAERFGLPAAMENDANAAALAEATHGAGSHADVVFYVQLSTGIGAGLVIDGSIYHGRGGAGEFGHVVVDPDGPICSCGNRGCLESVASGWALARDARRALLDAPHESELGRLKRQGVDADARTIITAARRGDSSAWAILKPAFSALGVAVANCVNLLDPDVIVLGGGLANASDILLPPLQSELMEHVVPHMRDPERLVLGQCGAHAPLVGAAIIADRIADERRGSARVEEQQRHRTPRDPVR